MKYIIIRGDVHIAPYERADIAPTSPLLCFRLGLDGGGSGLGLGGGLGVEELAALDAKQGLRHHHGGRNQPEQGIREKCIDELNHGSSFRLCFTYCSFRLYSPSLRLV
ncbi:MAG: hypothetical protein LBI54_08175 [Lachnospiraceae bacterium]|nr:hypothetical protein [Lachnospiraceae bacterium]